MGEELDELWNEDVEGSVQSVRVKLVVAVITDLVEGTECSLEYSHGNTPHSGVLGYYLTHGVVGFIDEVAESGQ